MLKIRAPALLHSTFGIWRVVWGILTSVERFFKNRPTLPTFVCLSFLCDPRADLQPFCGFYWNRFDFSIILYIRSGKSLTYAAKPTIILPSLGYLCEYLFRKRDRLLENCVKGRRFLFVIVANILIITKWIKFAMWLLRLFASPRKKP